jgi:hypothetical protein
MFDDDISDEELDVMIADVYETLCAEAAPESYAVWACPYCGREAHPMPCNPVRS